jgi:hypothetical protein
MDLQISFIKNKHDVLWHWNEIVLALPKPQMQDIVQAVFFLDSPDMNDHDRAEGLAKAQAVADVMGGKPYMRMQTHPGEEDLLSCPDGLLEEGMDPSIKIPEFDLDKKSAAFLRRKEATDVIIKA